MVRLRAHGRAAIVVVERPNRIRVIAKMNAVRVAPFALLLVLLQLVTVTPRKIDARCVGRCAAAALLCFIEGVRPAVVAVVAVNDGPSSIGTMKRTSRAGPGSKSMPPPCAPR